MKKVNLYLLVLMMLLVYGCTKDRNTNENPAGGAINTNTTGEDLSMDQVKVEPLISMRDYFPPDGSKVHFKGEGNEFAEFSMQVTQPHKDYFVIYEKNEGTIVRRIYKVNTDRIYILDTKIAGVTEGTFPSLRELDQMEPSGIYLQQPFTEGTEFDGWTIVQTGLTVETPYQLFENVFFIERKVEDAVERKYFASGFGEIKRESVMRTGKDEIYTITSTLEALGTE